MNYTKKPKVGLISPVGKVHSDNIELYGQDISFVPANAKVDSLTVEGYTKAIKNISNNVNELLEKEVDAISLMGTSLSFFKGKLYNEELIKTMSRQSGLPTSSMTSAIVSGIKHLNVKNIAVATVYSKEVTELLSIVLQEYGINTTDLEYRTTNIRNLDDFKTEDIVSLGKKAVKTKKADALLISCGGLHTIESIAQLEKELGIPVISSSVAGAWDSVRLVGHSGHANVGGVLLEEFS